ncbi:carbohydrate kinase family protein [Patescibacteria group bacterium]|jgi:sugar/nucleoside kinase (ribokinase family)|nr:carbohydrate kinase family protein [Patescibacteria group bacterium]
MPRFDILTIGSATQDVFIRSTALEEHHDDDAPDGIAACFLMGSKMSADELTFSTGGGATNAATTFARWGLKTACLTRIGKDLTGASLLADLKAEKIDTRFVQTDPKLQTAYSVILLSGSGHRAIFTHRGASQALDRRAFPWHHWTKKLANTRIAKWIYLTSVGGDMKILADIFEHAARTKTRIAWNPGNKELEKGMKQLKRFLLQTDVLSLNKEEADALGGLKEVGDLPRGAFLLTEGGHGATVRSQGKTLHVSALKVKRINTTGAGDAFGSGFVASWMRKEDPRAAMADALLNATGVITHMGAHAGILQRHPTQKERAQVRIR